MQNIPDNLIRDYLDGNLDEPHAAELSQWVQASKDNARYIASLAILEHGLIKHTKMQSNSDVLAEIQSPDEDVQPRPPIHIDTAALNRKKYVQALSYVLRHTFTPQRLIAGGIAAALLLGTALAIAMLTGPDQTDSPSIAETPQSTAPIDDSPKSTPPAQPPVATLTNTHNAKWSSPQAEGASAPGSNLSVGSPLHPNQRLTLTQGFAEITTHRGAIAIIEAPATIELTHNDNALRLHTGKLVGICETESSKGFVVATPHMDITDLGTRFGVACDPGTQTFVEVFDGQVQATSGLGSALASPVTLKTSEAIAIDAAGQSVAIHPHDRPAFTAPADRHAGLIAASPNVHLIDAPPPALGELEKADQPRANVYIESRRVVLPGEVAVHVTQPGRYNAFSGRGIHSSKVPAGTAVRSYIVQVVGVQDSSPIDSKHIVVTGQITFDTPVIGVISSAENWADFNRTVPGRSALPEDTQPGQASVLLEGADIQSREETSDQLTLEPDGRTLTFRCYMAKQGVDQFRVLVAAAPEDNQQQD